MVVAPPQVPIRTIKAENGTQHEEEVLQSCASVILKVLHQLRLPAPPGSEAALIRAACTSPPFLRIKGSTTSTLPVPRQEGSVSPDNHDLAHYLSSTEKQVVELTAQCFACCSRRAVSLQTIAPAEALLSSCIPSLRIKNLLAAVSACGRVSTSTVHSGALLAPPILKPLLRQLRRQIATLKNPARHGASAGLVLAVDSIIPLLRPSQYENSTPMTLEATAELAGVLDEVEDHRPLSEHMYCASLTSFLVLCRSWPQCCRRWMC